MINNYSFLIQPFKFNSCRKAYLTQILFFLIFCNLISAQSSNDNCANPISLNPLGTSCNNTSFTFTSNTIQSGTANPGLCNGETAYKDGWYTFTTGAATTSVTVTATTNRPWALSIYSGNCSGFTQVACNNAAANDPITLNPTVFPSTTYYIKISRTNSNSNAWSGTVCVYDTTPPNPCSSITSISTCGSTISNTFSSGTGAYSTSACGFSTPGREKIYSFTPTVSGAYSISQTSSFTYIDYQYKLASSGCSSTGWTCIDDITGAGTSPTFSLTGGQTYYFLLDPESTVGGNVSFSINCATITCTSGSGIGNSTIACLEIEAGGLNLNGTNPTPTDLCNGIPNITLEAEFTPLGNTNNYNVSSIPYSNLPYQYGCLANPISISVDDRWSNSISIPFSSGFCFYGTTYTSFVVGSNGMISFDASRLASTPTGYDITDATNNIPTNINTETGTSEYYFGPSIHGVHHDINPAVGGEVGWELITLETGCRAIVISWNNIPMFDNNSIQYTGMIVLYENTNIIEVYVKEKQLDFDGTTYWNDGNAILGIQKNATEGVVPTGRNATDGTPGWTATNEAWRFTPSGTSIASIITWYEGSGTSGSVVGTGNTISVSPVETTTYTAAVTYNFCNGATSTITDETTVTVTGGKVWDGSTNSDWSNNTNWTPAVLPTASDCVIIPDTANQPVISGTNYNGLAGTLRILDNATLTINSQNNLTVTDWVNISSDGTFIVNNDASLVQINNVDNITNGTFTYRRTADVRKLDYVYWSSPVYDFNINTISTPVTPGPIYIWNTRILNPNGGQGNWVAPTTAERQMIKGKGYIVRGPNSFSSTTITPFYAAFTGNPNNGTITIPIHRGSNLTNLNDNWNLVGNPYPSALRASQFIFDNSSKIQGGVNLWMHGISPSTSFGDPFYDNFLANYDATNDYYSYNFTGTSCCPAAGADLFIGSGQGFFIQMQEGTETVDDSNFVTFTNNMRSSSFPNTTFFRTSNSNPVTSPENSNFDINTIERHRIWLDIVNTSNNKSNRTLFGYIQGATMDKDNFYDFITQNSGVMKIYSLINDEFFTIQGRTLPFNNNDVVPIGISVPTSGNYSIAVAGVDGIFSTTQDFYLKDNLLNIIHDIKANPYHFTAVSGMYNDRFEIVYQTNALDNNDFTKSNIKVITNEKLTVVAQNQIMESIIVYNVLGQNIGTFNEINTEQVTLNSLPKNNTTLLLKIKLQSGETVTKKVIY